jgi:hypothetical protein
MKNLKTSFAKVGAYSSEENFILGDPEGVIDWINGEAEAFEDPERSWGYLCFLQCLRDCGYPGEGWLRPC